MQLSRKEESDICLKCGECCKRYSITILPQEVARIAKKAGLSRKKFLEEYCELFIKIYPKTTPGMLTCVTENFPKNVLKMLSKELSFTPPSFFIVPQIALKRIDNHCIFLNEDNTCQIYSDRPYPCQLFPFMVVEGYEENYPFCELFHKTNKDYSVKSRKYKKEIKDYFSKVDKKGFVKVWGSVPLKGKIFLNEIFLCELTIRELEKMLKERVK